ncbi:MAG: 16S rRNA (guanine(527)-N(7))-methyltransferase RsmG [Alphaproteobacteria bacterium]|nr:16S rRNA (guanine(527)-N(7))-methyltransferase RsmG [Alphaproteobacteria bacterium]
MPAEPLTPAAFAAHAGVSRETLARLQLYADLLCKWQKAINLVSNASLGDLWRRHIWDSAQLLPHIPAGTRSLLDLGSGAGFPGLVLAIMGVEGVVLVESDKRKCAFLREAARVAGAAVVIHDRRIEDLGDEIPPADVITARAVASLPLLLERIKLYMVPNTVCLFHKGKNVDAELAEIRQSWAGDIEKIPSVTDAGGVIIRMKGKPNVEFDNVGC